MIPQVYHILNGDALLDHFPDQIEGKRIVLRECLVDGPVDGTTLDEFYQTRAAFISCYGSLQPTDYYVKTVPQIDQLAKIPENAVVNLWFEDDLFCQVNFWFTCHMLMTNGNPKFVYLIRPTEHTQYGFGNYDPVGLNGLFEQKIWLDDIKPFADLWLAFQVNDSQKLKTIGESITQKYPFVKNAIQAQLDRDSPEIGPKGILRQIIQELETNDFGEIFSEFSHRAPIFGFGDLQVKRLYEEVLKSLGIDF